MGSKPKQLSHSYSCPARAEILGSCSDQDLLLILGIQIRVPFFTNIGVAEDPIPKLCLTKLSTVSFCLK